MKIGQLLNENIPQKLSIDGFAFTVTGLPSGVVKRLEKAIEAANEAMEAGVVIKSRFAEMKSNFGSVFSDACTMNISKPFFYGGEYKNLPEALHDLNYSLGYMVSMNKVSKLIAKYPEEEVSKAITRLFNEWKPVVVVLEDLKGKVTTTAVVRDEKKQAEAKAKAAIPKTELSKVVEAAIHAHKPELVANYTGYVQRLYSRMALDYPDFKGIYKNKGDSKVYENTLRPLLSNGALNPNAVKAAAEKYADMVEESMKDKIMVKAGDLQNPQVQALNGFTFVITGEYNGQKVSIEQTMILNVSSLGTLFNQFPARIYVDGKFKSEAAYKKMMV